MSQENLLIGVSIIQVLLIPIILFFSKQLISYFFNKTIDLKKAELAQNLENYKKEIEQETKNFQHQLDAKLQEFNIKFSTLHQERAIIIKDLYIKIIELQSSLLKITQDEQSNNQNVKNNDKEKIDRFNNAFIEFNNSYYTNKIYFSETTAEKINLLLNDFKNVSTELISAIIVKRYPLIDKLISDSKNIEEISNKVETKFPIIIKELENDFREILGVKN